MNVWDSARDGRPEVVLYLIQKEPRMVNQKDENDVTPLCYAVLGNQASIVKLLIENGAKVNTPSKTSVPLVFAAMNGNVEITKILLEHKSKIRALNKHGITPFHAAVTNGGANSAKLLELMLAADPECANYLSPSIGSGLHAACSEGSPLEIVQLLVEGGSDLTLLIPDSGRTPLHCAAGRGQHKVVEYLLSKGAQSVINLRDSQGMSALDLAALGGHTLACELLLNAGAESDGATQEQNMTPLFYAVQRHSNRECIFRLLERGLKADHVTKPKVTPLHIAVSVPGCDEVVDILIKHGADINALDCDNNTPAHYALLNANLDGYGVMVKRNADLTVKNSRGYTPEELYKEMKEKQEQQGEGTVHRETAESMDSDEPVQSDDNLKFCAGCGKKETKPNTFKRCSKCKKVNYCSQGCQLKDWKLGHNKKCGSA